MCAESRQEGRVVVRQSNFELLRIVAMVLIVAFHLAVHSGFAFPTDTITVNRLWIQLMQIGGKVGVDIFVLISGYFLVSAKTVKTNRAVKLWTQLLFYSVLIFVIFTAAGVESFGFVKMFKQFAPVIYSRWWFASTYFVLYLLSPYLNLLLKSFGRKRYIGFLILLFVLWCFIPSFTGLIVQSNALLWFVFLYSLAGYYKLYGIGPKLSGNALILLSVLCIFLTYAVTVLLDVLGLKHPVFAAYATFFYDMQRIPVLVISLLMFMGFSRLRIKNSKLINVISSATFGVYLIHDHNNVCNFLWKTLFQNASYANSRLLIPHTLVALVTVYVACTVIELLRIYLIENRCLPLYDFVANFIDAKKEALLSSRIFSKHDD